MTPDTTGIKTLNDIQKEAAARGLKTEWVESDDRTVLGITPELCEPYCDDFGLGLGVCLGGKEVAVWICCAWAGTILEPKISLNRDASLAEELDTLKKVTDLDEALAIFDKTMRNFIADMRRDERQVFPGSVLAEWPDVSPLARRW